MIVTTDKNVFSGRDIVTHKFVVIRKGETAEVSDKYGKHLCYEHAPNITEVKPKKKAKV